MIALIILIVGVFCLYAAIVNPGTQRCPSCQKNIDLLAIKCPYCTIDILGPRTSLTFKQYTQQGESGCANYSLRKRRDSEWIERAWDWFPLILMGSVLVFLFPPVGLLMFAAAAVMIAWGSHRDARRQSVTEEPHAAPAKEGK